MNKRRVKQKLQITYDTPAEKVQQFVRGIDKILRENKDVNQDFMLVKFTEFQESSLEIFIYYFTTTIAWVEYLEIRGKQQLCLHGSRCEYGGKLCLPNTQCRNKRKTTILIFAETYR